MKGTEKKRKERDIVHSAQGLTITRESEKRRG